MTNHWIFGVILALSPAVVWHVLSQSTLIRQGTAFGVRVGPGVDASQMAREIRMRFRLQVWLWALAVAVVCAITRRNNRDLCDIAGPIATLLGGFLAFSMAHRSTRNITAPMPAPSVRAVSLFAEESRGTFWLTVLEWMGMLLPLAFPIAACILIVLQWNNFPPHLKLHWEAGKPIVEHLPPIPDRYLASALCALVIAIAVSACQFALSFHARSSDWAPDAYSSRKYRFVLGFAPVPLLSYIILQICILAVMPLSNTFSFLKTVDMAFSPRWSLIIFVVLSAGALGARSWLKRHFETQSGDAMPDSCWKLGFFYVNRADLALAVPSRQGLGYSLNYARPLLWVAGGVLLAAGLFAWFYSRP